MPSLLFLLHDHAVDQIGRAEIVIRDPEGSIFAGESLAVILLEGGLKTPVSMLRLALWPAALLATIGVGLTAGVVGAAVWLIDGVPVAAALLAGAAAAPTAAAVAVLLRRAGAALPSGSLPCSGSSPGSTTRCRCS